MHPYSPWADLACRDIVVEYDYLPPDTDALWLPSSRVIVIDRRLNQAQKRSALAHELAHVDLGHVPMPHDPATAAAQEIAADHVAARHLIPIGNLVEAILWSQDESEVAEYLWVDEATVRNRLAGLSVAEKDRIDAALRSREWEVYGEEESA